MDEKLRTFGAFGLRIAAPFSLTALRPATGPADIAIALDEGPEGPLYDQARWSVEDAGDRVVFDIGALSFAVEGGRRIAVTAAPSVAHRELVTWLTGPVMGAALLQRGMLAVHANAVVFADGEAAAMLGSAGDGKSTLAAALDAGGVEPLCDDLLGISFNADGHPLVHPGIPRVKLKPEAADRLGIDVSNAPFVGAGMQKYEVALRKEAAWDRSFRLSRLYVLERGPLAIEPIRGQRAAAVLLENLFWPDAQEALPGYADRFVQAMRLAEAADCFVYRRPFDLDRIVETRDALIDHLRTPLQL
ncbi:hypothetical protein WJT74_11895 [Sphingomicrobium sp. XHP0239]|uniref:hypothetical protein n=1 Tax=Sphingomicrobium maritimum TaxID=3133972 RepID=UPI0031CCA430